MVDVPTLKQDFAARMLDDKIPIGIGPDGKMDSFPLSELAARTAKRDADEKTIEMAIAEAFGEATNTSGAG